MDELERGQVKRLPRRGEKRDRDSCFGGGPSWTKEDGAVSSGRRKYKSLAVETEGLSSERGVGFEARCVIYAKSGFWRAI